MNKVIQFESAVLRRRGMEEAACVWLARLEAGASDEDLRGLACWLCESKEHVEVFFEVAAAWDHLSILSELAEVFPLEKYSPPASKGYFRGLGGIGAAFSLLLALTLFLGTVGYKADYWFEADRAEITSYKTDIGQRSTVTLPDDSQIILNTNTLIEVSYSEVERRIVLEQGEGLFTVTKDSERPFRVVVGSHIVEAVGTAFTVQRTPQDSVEVMVKEGVVDLRSSTVDDVAKSSSNGRQAGESGDGKISLVAGEIVTSGGPGNEVIQRQYVPLEEIETRISWQHGMLFFLGDPLEKVLKEVNRYTTTIIEADDEIRDIRVDGSFRVGDIDALLVAMEENFDIEVLELGNGNIYLTKRKTN